MIDELKTEAYKKYRDYETWILHKHKLGELHYQLFLNMYKRNIQVYNYKKRLSANGKFNLQTNKKISHGIERTCSNCNSRALRGDVICQDCKMPLDD